MYNMELCTGNWIIEDLIFLNFISNLLSIQQEVGKRIEYSYSRIIGVLSCFVLNSLEMSCFLVAGNNRGW